MTFIRLEGAGGIAKGLRGLADSPALRRRMAEKLSARAQNIMNVSQQIVPVSEHGSHGRPAGFLRDSAIIYDPEYKTTYVQVDMGYTAPYAIYVHEDLYARHPHGQAKFLEKPVLAEKRGVLDDLLDVVDSVVQDLGAVV